MKIGFNMLLWTPFVTEEHYPLFKTLRNTGYDGVEIPLFNGDVKHYANVGRALIDNGLLCTAVTVIPDQAHNPISPNEKEREGARTISIGYWNVVRPCMRRYCVVPITSRLEFLPGKALRKRTKNGRRRYTGIWLVKRGMRTCSWPSSPSTALNAIS